MEKKSLNSVKIRSPPSRAKLLKLLRKGIPKFIGKLNKENISRIILFGSYATNNYHYGSDVDLLIIVNEKDKELFGNFLDFLTNLSLEYEWAPQIITKEEFERRKREHYPFIKQIIQTGITLWSDDN